MPPRSSRSPKRAKYRASTGASGTTALLFVGLSASPVLGQQAIVPTYVAAPYDNHSMSVGRWAATATLLPNGAVLIVGGYSFADKDTLRSADVFHPITGAFTPAAPLAQDRNFATATLLSDGKVLVAGGYSEHHGSLNKAEVYDPAIDRWTPTASTMIDHRELYTATALRDGQVLLVAGLSLARRGTIASAERYDPATDRFVATAGSLLKDRFGQAAARLPDGRVLIVGGQSWQIGHPSETLASAEIYDPTTDRFIATGSLKRARDRPTATPLPDGRILVAGGTNKGAPPKMAEIYDPKTGAFTDAAPLAEGRMAHDACALPGGRVVVAGGWSDARKATTPTVEVYDPTFNTWSRLPDLSFAAHDLCLVLLRDGRLIAVGGKCTNGDENTATSVAVTEVVQAGSGP